MCSRSSGSGSTHAGTGESAFSVPVAPSKPLSLQPPPKQVPATAEMVAAVACQGAGVAQSHPKPAGYHPKQAVHERPHTDPPCSPVCCAALPGMPSGCAAAPRCKTPSSSSCCAARRPPRCCLSTSLQRHNSTAQRSMHGKKRPVAQGPAAAAATVMVGGGIRQRTALPSTAHMSEGAS